MFLNSFIRRICVYVKKNYRKYPNLVRTKKQLFSRVRTIISIKEIITKKSITKLGYTKIIFIDRCALIFREPFI